MLDELKEGGIYYKDVWLYDQKHYLDLLIRDTGDNKTNHGIFDDKKLTKVSACMQIFTFYLKPLYRK